MGEIVSCRRKKGRLLHSGTQSDSHCQSHKSYTSSKVIFQSYLRLSQGYHSYDSHLLGVSMDDTVHNSPVLSCTPEHFLLVQYCAVTGPPSCRGCRFQRAISPNRPSNEVTLDLKAIQFLPSVLPSPWRTQKGLAVFSLALEAPDSDLFSSRSNQETTHLHARWMNARK